MEIMEKKRKWAGITKVKAKVINILFYYSFVIFKRFNNVLIDVYWVLLGSPNLDQYNFNYKKIHFI